MFFSPHNTLVKGNLKHPYSFIIRVVKIERIFTKLHWYLWFLLPNLMEKKDPWLVSPKKVSLDGGRDHFKMATEAPDMASPTFFYGR